MTNQTGNIVALAGLLVTIANHFGLNIIQSDAEAIVGAGAVTYGIIHQMFTHKKEVAIAAGIK